MDISTDKCKVCAEWHIWKKRCKHGLTPDYCDCVGCMCWDTAKSRCVAGKKLQDCDYPLRPWYSPTLWMFVVLDRPLLNLLVPRRAKEEYRRRKQNGEVPSFLDLLRGIRNRGM